MAYNIAWTPAASVASGGNTLNPTVALTTNTTYTITVSSPTAQGGYTFADTFSLAVQDIGVTAAFAHSIRYGCSADTVPFFANSAAQTGTPTYRWYFGDGTSSNQ